MVAKPIPGRPAKLSEEQVRTVYAILLGKDPRQLQFDFALWTRWMVRDLITRLFDVELTEQSVGQMLRRLGMSPQRPLARAYEQDPETVDSAVFIEFCRRLLHDDGGTVFLILKDGCGRSSCSLTHPELNPDE